MRLASVDITSELQLHSLHSQRTEATCSNCTRRLLPGETLHLYESGSSLCTLCAAGATEPAARREQIRATRVGLAVVPKAA